ncbi:MAG: FAD-binding oxidoreductase [Polyangiales bacterium]
MSDRTPRGQTFRRGDAGYEAARRETMWNARVPSRFPEVIVQANDERDVVDALSLAKREGHRVGVRSGGHSWAGNHVRDGGLLLDVSRLDEVTVDEANLRATVGPGRKGHQLGAMLARRKLFFPTGHCRGVAVGGYLLQGGFGWHSRALGPACESVVAIDVVTAEGERLHASATENTDLYWSARGAGPGFFGVVTRFHLRLHRRPRVIGLAFQSFPMDRLEEVFRWAHRVGPEVSSLVELQLIVSRRAAGVFGPGIEVFAPVFADDLRSATNALSFLTGSAIRRRARVRTPFIPATVSSLLRGVGTHYPDGRRYGVDNMWTHAPIDALLPGLEKIAATLPPPPSHMLWLNWAPPPDRSAMAFSMEDDLYLALYGCWKHEADDDRYARWAPDRMREMASLASGCQLADENLGQRPAKFIADDNLARLDAIRAARDPHTRFHPWMGRP